MKPITICPVSFINNEIVVSDDLNNIFVTPYRLKNISDISKRESLDTLGSKLTPESYEKFARDYGVIDMQNRDKIIDSYIEMNVLDLYTSSINWLRSTYFKSFELPSMVISGGKKMLPEFTFNSIHMANTLNPFDAQTFTCAVTLYMDEYMDIAINVISTLYNNWVTDDINQLKDNDLIDILYAELFQITYGNAPSKQVDDLTKYTFCLTTCREIVEMQLVKIRQGLVMIARNAVNMILEQHGFLSTVTDPNYSKDQLLEDNGCYKLLGVEE